MIIAGIDDETDPARAGELEDDCVDPGDMIREQKEAAGRKILLPGDVDAVDQARESQSDGIKESFRE